MDVFFRECVETLRNGYGLSADDVEQHPFTTTYTGRYAVNDVDLVLDRIVQTLRPSVRKSRHAYGQPEGQYAGYAQPVPKSVSGAAAVSIQFRGLWPLHHPNRNRVRLRSRRFRWSPKARKSAENS